MLPFKERMLPDGIMICMPSTQVQESEYAPGSVAETWDALAETLQGETGTGCPLAYRRDLWEGLGPVNRIAERPLLPESCTELKGCASGVPK